ncbi:hypothetical protein A9C19_18675 [Bacillus weihaiensis]|uniref:Uncharacterized protein n=1 Tax=Bacillus weihaiensis TaxID=1547283 RepID=A0A1L3MW68_9BACI|nr:hypothetical protein A9C19_18675 [Bacillus weihaiensis]
MSGNIASLRKEFFQLKKDLLSSILSVGISLILFPFLLGMENSLKGPIFSYIEAFIMYAIFSLPYLILIGVPVHIVSRVATKNMKTYKWVTSFFLHVIPALLIGYFLFKNTLFFLGSTVVISVIFFSVGYLLNSIGASKRQKLIIALLPFILWLLILIPTILTETTNKALMNEPNPEVEVLVNETSFKPRPSFCWNSDGSAGCFEDKEPFLLPIDPIGEEIQTNGDVTVKVLLHNTERSYTIEAYYFDEENSIQKVTGDPHSFTLPQHIQEQAVKVIATMDSSKKGSFFIPIRTGNR